MLVTEPVGTTTAKTPWNTVVEKDAKNKLMRGRWRPADTSLIDRVVVRMTILRLNEAKPYSEVEGDSVSPSSSLKVPIETDAGSALRHWWMLFRVPKPEFGERTQSEWEKLDKAELAELEERDYQGRVEEEAGRAPALDPSKPAWMQVDVTMDAGGGYRIFWKPAPTSGVGARADYAGSCTLTVGQVRVAMGDLAKQYTEYVNPTPRPGDAPVLDLYSCHTFVRRMNTRLGLGIDIPTIDKYT